MVVPLLLLFLQVVNPLLVHLDFRKGIHSCHVKLYDTSSSRIFREDLMYSIHSLLTGIKLACLHFNSRFSSFFCIVQSIYRFKIQATSSTPLVPIMRFVYLKF